MTPIKWNDYKRSFRWKKIEIRLEKDYLDEILPVNDVDISTIKAPESYYPLEHKRDGRLDQPESQGFNSNDLTKLKEDVKGNF